MKGEERKGKGWGNLHEHMSISLVYGDNLGYDSIHGGGRRKRGQEETLNDESAKLALQCRESCQRSGQRREIWQKYNQGNKLREHIATIGQSEPYWRCSGAANAPENVKIKYLSGMLEWGWVGE